MTRIMNSAQHMERIIADLPDLTRSRLGVTIPLSGKAPTLQKLCEGAVLEIGAARPEAVVRLETSGNLTGIWDTDRLAQVIWNLVGNAIQYGAGTPVSITAQGQGDAVSPAAHNGGTPIPPNMLPAIFEPLTRGGAEGGVHSIGLGLFIARGIVSAHGGDIRVKSSSDQGTTFTVRLPKLERSS